MNYNLKSNYNDDNYSIKKVVEPQQPQRETFKIKRKNTYDKNNFQSNNPLFSSSLF